MESLHSSGAEPKNCKQTGGAKAERSAETGPDYLASLRLMAAYLTDSRWQMAAAISLATLATACELLPLWAVYRVVDTAVAGNLTEAQLGSWILLALVGVIAGYAALGLAMALSHIVAFDAIYRLRLHISRHMARLPLGYFSMHSSGDTRKLVIDEPEKLETIVAHGLPEGVSALAAWLAVSLWLFIVDWRMALVTIFVTPLSFLLLGTAMTRGGRRASAYQAAAARMNASIVEYLAGMPVVKVFNRTGESLAETSNAVRDYARIETEWARDYIPLGGSFYTLVLTNIAFILPAGLYLYQAGTLSLSALLFFLLLGANYSQPLLKLFNQFHTLAHISMGSTLVAELLATPAQADKGKRVTLPNHDIEFDNVSFAYTGRDVLHNVSFTARNGEITALVGPSGSGKSTIASLVPRFWDLDRGSVRIGGVDVRDISLEQLMDTVAFVFQSTFLFSDTIAANIRFGRASASDAEVEAAARAARAHDFISALPEGYNTRLGDHGANLSGGERQRLAIARAILKDAPVVILDEATAFADPDNETAIQEAIGELTRGRTLLVVAHRLHTIASADRIIVLEQGRLVENGKHATLLEEGGLYATMWREYRAAGSLHYRTQRLLSQEDSNA